MSHMIKSLKPSSPYRIFELSLEEKILVIAAIKAAIEAKIFSIRWLSQKLGVNLRWILSSQPREGTEGGRGGGQPAYGLWVKLYDYCMGSLEKVSIARLDEDDPALKRLLDLIAQLERLAADSERYQTDMHIFNNRIIKLESFDIRIPADIYNIYIAIRKASSGDELVASALRIQNVSGRDVFISHTFAGTEGRETRGFAYMFGGYLHLFGFLTNGKGVESFCVRRWSGSVPNFAGTINTVSKQRGQHSKPVFMARATSLAGFLGFDAQKLLRLDDEHLPDEAMDEELRQRLSRSMAENTRTLGFVQTDEEVDLDIVLKAEPLFFFDPHARSERAELRI